MYKKITHHIVEEHFDHPATLPNGMLSMPNGTTAPSAPNNVMAPTEGAVMFTATSGALPQYVMNEQTMLFRMDARTAWTKWAFSLMNYAVSLNGDLPGTDQVKGRVHKSAVALGEFIIPYYGLTTANALSTALIAINDIGMHYVEAMKAKKTSEELAKIADTWKPYVADIAKLLNEVNPNNWPKGLLEDIFANLVSAWQDQLTARAKGDIVADEIAIDRINKLISTGLPDHVKHGFSSLADIFSRGIIAQFPAMFTL
jgi:hypothetical protein